MMILFVGLTQLRCLNAIGARLIDRSMMDIHILLTRMDNGSLKARRSTSLLLLIYNEARR